MTQWQEYIEKISGVKNAAELDALELQLLGRKQGALTDAMKALSNLSPEEKKEKGRELNQWKQKITDAITDRRSTFTEASLASIALTDAIDITLTLPERGADGHLHLIPEFIRQVEDVFTGMGFDVSEGPEVESEEFNFTKLNIPATHAARDMQGTFFIKGKPDHVLRTHTSPVQIRYMQSHKPPFRMICPGRVYRKDSDATHSPMFHQFEGLMIGKDVSMANMKAVMVAAMKQLIGDDIEFRFRTSYFPFVEPGVEVDMRWKTGDGSGRWLEVVGCGMVHPNVLKNARIDPDEWKGFAFGFGIERLIMIKHRVPDLRTFYESDLRFVSQF